MQNKTKIKITKNFFENLAWKFYFYACGIDEVGRGCLAGPLVTSAVILPQNTEYKLLKDSKILNEQEREAAFEWIIKNCFYSTAITCHKKIDKINIYQATLQTMKKALLQLLQSAPIDINQIKYVLVDAMPLSLKNLNCYNNIQIKFFDKGETLSSSIAAASIVAKVTRDRLMKKMNYIFPRFNLHEHKGYGTTNHVKVLLNLGPSIIHRKTFISKILRERSNEIRQQILF